jgi:hypothetical protein
VCALSGIYDTGSLHVKERSLGKEGLLATEITGFTEKKRLKRS